jgi:putative Holliday junction resolvase
MRVMGLDVGSRTVGIAVSDPMGWTAQGVEIIRINEDEGEFGFDRLKELVDQYEVNQFVVGPRAEASMAYGKKIEELYHIPVTYQDERLTTVQAERMLVEQANTSRAKRKKVIDKVAAVMILQNYLDGAGKKLF